MIPLGNPPYPMRNPVRKIIKSSFSPDSFREMGEKTFLTSESCSLAKCAQHDEIVTFRHVGDSARVRPAELNVRFVQDDEHGQLEQHLEILVGHHAAVRVIRRGKKQYFGLVLCDSSLDSFNVDFEGRGIEPRNIHDDATSHECHK